MKEIRNEKSHSGFLLFSVICYVLLAGKIKNLNLRPALSYLTCCSDLNVMFHHLKSPGLLINDLIRAVFFMNAGIFHAPWSFNLRVMSEESKETYLNF